MNVKERETLTRLADEWRERAETFGEFTDEYHELRLCARDLDLLTRFSEPPAAVVNGMTITTSPDRFTFIPRQIVDTARTERPGGLHYVVTVDRLRRHCACGYHAPTARRLIEHVREFTFRPCKAHRRLCTCSLPVGHAGLHECDMDHKFEVES